MLVEKLEVEERSTDPASQVTMAINFIDDKENNKLVGKPTKISGKAGDDMSLAKLSKFIKDILINIIILKMTH